MAETTWEQVAGMVSDEDTDNIESYSEQALASKNAAAVSAAAAEAAKIAAAASEVDAESAEANAAASEAAAASSASSASTSATTATTKASEASTSATNAATSATAAQTAQTASEAAQAAAETAETNAGVSETNAATSASASASSAAAALASQTAAAGSASAASASETAAAASEAAASTSETNAATSAASAASSATSASTSASTATTKASEASTSATNAAASEGNAATSASSAASSASAAEASKDAALAALDSFDDRYLGQKASDPTVDNDGDPLVAGALYFNTTDGVMKVYDGSLWVAAYASLSGALLQANNLSDLNNAATARTNLGLGTAATTASSDYATAAQGALADSAVQPNDSPTFVNVTVTGTVDGRDVAADGSKLDGIEAGATADQTASEILTAIKTVDGTGSGLDADLLDGNDSAFFYPASNPNGYTTNVGDITGVTAGSFITGGGTSGNVTVNVDATSANTASKVVARDASGNFSAGTITAALNGNASTASTLQTARNIALTGAVTGNANFNGGGNISITTTATSDPTLTLAGDVTGSATFTNLGNATLTVGVVDNYTRAPSGPSGDFNTQPSYSYVSSINATANTPFGNAWYNLVNIRHRGGVADGVSWGAQIVTGMTAHQNRMAMRTQSSGVWSSWSEIWNAGNDGAGSGLDADLWDGNQFASYLNQAVLTTSSPTFNNIYVENVLFHSGDTNTYMQFHAEDQWRVVTGNVERFEINNNDVTVQSALKEKYVALSGTTPSIDVDAGGGFSLTTSGNTTFTFAAFSSALSCAFILELTAGGAHTITWPASVDWAGGTAPDAPASGETDIYVFWSRNGGTTWYGVQSIDAAA